MGYRLAPAGGDGQGKRPRLPNPDEPKPLMSLKSLMRLWLNPAGRSTIYR
jgi:hypothetical protein